MASRVYFSAYDATERSNTDAANYTDGVTLTFTPNASKDYIVLWSCLAKLPDASNSCHVRLFETSERVFQTWEAKEVTSPVDYRSHGGMYKFTSGGSPSSMSFKIQFRREAGTATANAKEFSIVALELGANDVYAESTARSTTTNTSAQTKLTLNITPPSTGDYLILYSANVDATAGLSMEVNALVDGSTVIVNTDKRVAKDTTDRMPWMRGYKKTGWTNAAHTAAITYDAGDAGTVGIEHARIVALRLSDFDANYYAEDFTGSSSTSATYVDEVTLTDTVATAGDHLLLALGTSQPVNSATVSSLMDVQEDGATLQENSHETPVGSVSDEGPTICIRIRDMTAASHTWKLRRRSETTSVTTNGDGSIAVLQVEAPVTASDGAASGTGTATAVGASLAASPGTATGAGTATGVGASVAAAVGSASGTGAATAVGVAAAPGAGAASGTGTASGVGSSTAASPGASSGTGTATGVGASTAASAGAATGTGTAAGVGASTAESVGASSGAGTATAVGAAVAEAVASATGTGAAEGVGEGEQPNEGAGAAAGVGTATGVGASTAESIGAATGTGSAAGVGAATAAGAGTSSGQGTATAVGASIAEAVGAASGTGTASGITDGAVASVGESAGSGTAAAVGAADFLAVGAASSSSAAAAVGEALAAGVGAASGSGQAAAVGASIAEAVGTASGLGFATAIGVALLGGDEFRSAFRAEQAAILDETSIPWELRDTLNTPDQPDAGAGFIFLEFFDGDEEQFTFSAPGNNLFREEGEVFVHVVAPLGIERDAAETYAEAIRTAYRARRFPVGSRSVRITSTAPLGNGEVLGGMWAETVALSYEIFNIG